MLTSFFSILNNNAAVKVLMGSAPLRVFPYGTKINLPAQKPYALYGLFNSIPYNYLGDSGDMDLSGIQVDVYADSSSSLINCYNAIRDAIEGKAYLTSFSTPDIDIEDGLYQVRMEFDFHDER